MPNPNAFLWALTKEGEEMILYGHWNEPALDRLHALILRLRTSPAKRLVGGRYIGGRVPVRVLRPTGRYCISCARS